MTSVNFRDDVLHFRERMPPVMVATNAMNMTPVTETMNT